MEWVGPIDKILGSKSNNSIQLKNQVPFKCVQSSPGTDEIILSHSSSSVVVRMNLKF